MTLSDASPSPNQGSLASEVMQLVRSFQAHWALNRETPATELQAKAALEKQLEEDMGALKSKLLPSLVQRVSSKWTRYYGGPGVHSPTVRDQVNVRIAEDAFTGIFLHLIKQPINPSLDDGAIVSFLCKVGGRSLIDQYRKLHGRSRRTPDGGDDAYGGAGGPRRRPVFVPLDDFESHDPLAADLDQRLCDLETYQAVQAFWQKGLANDERLIMDRRHGEVPPRPYAEIAAELGQPGKKGEANVRQRYSQVLKRTREHLRSLGLLDDSG